MLSEFLNSTVLRTSPDYVNHLIKSAHSKNITITDWNQCILQFKAILERISDTYVGFQRTVEDLNSLNLTAENAAADIRTLNGAIQTLQYVQNSHIEDYDEFAKIVSDTFEETSLILQTLQNSIDGIAEYVTVSEQDLDTMLQEVFS